MTRLQTTLIILVLLAAALAVSLAAFGWLEFAHNWPLMLPEGLRDCLDWSVSNFREFGLPGALRCLP